VRTSSVRLVVFRSLSSFWYSLDNWNKLIPMPDNANIKKYSFVRAKNFRTARIHEMGIAMARILGRL